MIYKMTKKQLEAIKNLMRNLMSYAERGYGRVSNIQVMVNSIMPTKIFVKFEKEFTSSGEMDYEYVIMQVNEDGTMLAINDQFKNMFDRYNFISESKTFDIQDSTQYQIVD